MTNAEKKLVKIREYCKEQKKKTCFYETARREKNRILQGIEDIMTEEEIEKQKQDEEQMALLDMAELLTAINNYSRHEIKVCLKHKGLLSCYVDRKECPVCRIIREQDEKAEKIKNLAKGAQE